MNLLATLVVFAAVIYLQGFRVEIPVKSSRQRGMRGSYPIRLFYTSNMPIMLQSALSSNVFLFSQMLYSRFSDNLLVKLLGVWEPREGSSQLYANSGIAYYMSPPLNFTEALLDPVHTAVYMAFMLVCQSTFHVSRLSQIWKFGTSQHCLLEQVSGLQPLKHIISLFLISNKHFTDYQ